MARKLRVQYPGAIYHVMNRGDRRQGIFLSDQDRALFVETLDEGLMLQRIICPVIPRTRFDLRHGNQPPQTRRLADYGSVEVQLGRVGQSHSGQRKPGIGRAKLVDCVNTHHAADGS